MRVNCQNPCSTILSPKVAIGTLAVIAVAVTILATLSVLAKHHVLSSSYALFYHPEFSLAVSGSVLFACAGFSVGSLIRNYQNRYESSSIKDLENPEKASLDNDPIDSPLERFDGYVEKMQILHKKFIKVIEDPDEPLEISEHFSAVSFIFSYQTMSSKVHQEKVDEFWDALTIMFLSQNLIISQTNNKIEQKQEEVLDLRNKLTELRRDFYRKFLQRLDDIMLLQEARKYYLKRCTEEELKRIQSEVESMTLETIMPKLQEKISESSFLPYRFVEMEEIVKLFNKTPDTEDTHRSE